MGRPQAQSATIQLTRVNTANGPKLVDLVKGILPHALIPLARNLYHRAFRLQLRIRCWLSDRMPRRAADPIPPALLRFSVGESISIEEFDRIGAGCARLVEEHLRAAGIPLESLQRVLDFGCGCGRVLRHFLNAYPLVAFEGVDVDSKAISWCKTNLLAQNQMKPARFHEAGHQPPLSYPSGYFDAVYAISVFTHLNEFMQDAWLAELARIVRPLGALLITVYGPNVSRGLTPECSEAFATFGFAHQTAPKLRSLVPEWYNTSWHSREYIVNRLEKLFEEVHYSSVPDGLQDVVVACRPKTQAHFTASS